MPCPHQPCTCLAEGDDYCSPLCRTAAVDGGAAPVMDAASVPLTDCGCGHAECAGTLTAARDM